MKRKIVLKNKTKALRMQTQIELLNERLKIPQKPCIKAKIINAIERRKSAIEFVLNQNKTVKWTEVEKRFLIDCCGGCIGTNNAIIFCTSVNKG